MKNTPYPSFLRTSLPGAALAVLALAGPPVHAQSSVSIYGIIDAGLTHSNDGTTTLLPGKAAADTWIMKAGNTSRLGFRGNEDLGGGGYARFQLEHRFASDTGAPSEKLGTGKRQVAARIRYHHAALAQCPARLFGQKRLSNVLSGFLSPQPLRRGRRSC